MCVVFCTRNRPDELKIAVEHVVRAAGEMPEGVPVEVMVVDDGELAEDDVRCLREMVAAGAMDLRYARKRGRPGLLASRVEAVAKSEHDVVVFLDDDVVVGHRYLVDLWTWFMQGPEQVVGVGGVDRNMPRARWGTRWFERLTFVRAFRAANLSLAGFSGSMDEWTRYEAPKVTEFLSGCNMAFRRTALAGLEDHAMFEGSSIGEDILVSREACLSGGTLVVDPGLAVWHRPSPLTRHSERTIAETRMRYHRYLLELRGGRRVSFLALAVAGYGLVVRFGVKSLVQRLRSEEAEGRDRIIGTLAGMRGLGSRLALGEKERGRA